MSRGRFRVVLQKEDFKFSAAHFTVFSPSEAEPLHGHNYRVKLEISGESLDGLGFLVEFQELKRHVRSACAELDERTLIPTANPYIECREEGSHLIVDFATRSYRFPCDEVLLLPVENATVELFARFLWDRLAPHLDRERVDWLSVAVQETDGQLCYFESVLTDHRPVPKNH